MYKLLGWIWLSLPPPVDCGNYIKTIKMSPTHCIFNESRREVYYTGSKYMWHWLCKVWNLAEAAQEEEKGEGAKRPCNGSSSKAPETHISWRWGAHSLMPSYILCMQAASRRVFGKVQKAKIKLHYQNLYAWPKGQ